MIKLWRIIPILLSSCDNSTPSDRPSINASHSQRSGQVDISPGKGISANRIAPNMAKGREANEYSTDSRSISGDDLRNLLNNSVIRAPSGTEIYSFRADGVAFFHSSEVSVPGKYIIYYGQICIQAGSLFRCMSIRRNPNISRVTAPYLLCFGSKDKDCQPVKIEQTNNGRAK